MLLGYLSGWSGVVIGSVAMIASVLAEAIYAVWHSRSHVQKLLAQAPLPTASPLTYRMILVFYYRLR